MQHDSQQAKAMALRLEADLFATPVEDADEDDEMKDDKSNVDKLKRTGVNTQLEEAASGHVEQRIRMLWGQKGLDKAEDDLTFGEAREKARIELDHWLSYLRNALHT